jgi:PAS domain S-box-containing protein
MGIEIDRSKGSAESSFAWRRILWLAGVGVAYSLTHHLAFLFPDAGRVLMAIWPAAGVGLAALLLSPRRLWPAILAVIFISGILSDLVGGRPFLASLGFMTANTLESLACGWMILRTVGQKPTFCRVREVVALLAAAVFVNAVTSLVGAGTARLVGVAPFWAFWETWWIEDGLGILILTPTIVAWACRPKPRAEARWPSFVEVCLFLVVWCMVAWLSFNEHAALLSHTLQPYFLVALLAWPALRFSQRVTTLALFMLAVIAVTSAAVRSGPLLWGGEDPTLRLLQAQLFVWVVTAAGLLLAASHAEARSAERGAREDQLRIRALGDNIPDGMVYQAMCDLDGRKRFLYVSAGVQRLHGLSAEAVLADPQTLYGLIVEEDRPTVLAAEDAAVRSMSTFHVEARFRRPDGEIRWMQLASSPRRLADGRILWDGIQTDISARKKAEEDAREQTALLEAQLAASIEGILVVDTKGNKVLQNQRCVELWKIPPDIVKNNDDKQQIDFVKNRTKDPGAFVRQVIHLYAHPNETSHDEVEFKDGMVLDRYSAPVVGKDGNHLGRIWTFRDITERKQAEAKLATSEERFRKLFEESPIGIAILGKEREFTLTNQSYRDLLRLDEDEIRKRGLVGILHTDSWKPTLELSNRLRSGEIPMFHREQRYVRGDGTALWADTHVTAVRDQNAQVLHTICWVQDVTQRKQAEEEKTRLQEQLAHAQKMESVGRLAGGVAHDFNNMLGVILGHVELALEDVDPAQPLHALLEEVHKAAKRSAELTRQLLAFARKQTIAPKVLDLDQHVGGLLGMLKRLVGENVKLAWLPGADLWPIKIDPSQVDQILANLCVNARDAIADIGKITIEAENASVGAELLAAHPDASPGEYVRIAVSDDGCGMDEQTLARIFEPYFTTKGIGRGTGLGLATVYGTVKQSNGFVHVDGGLGKGATFTIYLPRCVGQVEPALAKSAHGSGTREKTTILVVEDESALLEIAARMLERLGYNVLTASTPNDAIRLAQVHAGKIRLLITDVVMPEMNGRDLARHLLAVDPSLKSLFMSGYTDDLIANHGALDEGVQFLQKPFSAQGLAAKVQEILGGE